MVKNEIKSCKIFEAADCLRSCLTFKIIALHQFRVLNIEIQIIWFFLFLDYYIFSTFKFDNSFEEIGHIFHAKGAGGSPK